MTSRKIPQSCPSCEKRLKIERLRCESCTTQVTGEFTLPRLARLSSEDQRFLELFVLASGNLKETGKRLGLSYPTVRKRLDEISARLSKEIEADQYEREKVVEKVGEGSKTVAQAENALKKL